MVKFACVAAYCFDCNDFFVLDVGWVEFSLSWLYWAVFLVCGGNGISLFLWPVGYLRGCCCLGLVGLLVLVGWFELSGLIEVYLALSFYCKELYLSYSCYSFAAMPRLYEYEIINELPPGAITVSQYAKDKGCVTSYIYHLIKRGKADFKIVVFQNINFIVSLKKK